MHPSNVPQKTPPTPDPVVRDAVRQLLLRSEAFSGLPPDKQRELARDTAMIADYLARPEGFDGRRLPGGLAAPAPPPAQAMVGPSRFLMPGGSTTPETSFQDAQRAVDAIGDEPFRASAAREGANVAGMLMQQVNFPTFVSQLIQGVFQAIVTSSIEQMTAYQEMIASVAKSLGSFMEDNVSENQGRDHMVEKFPDLFEIGVDEFSDNPSPRLRLRDGVEESTALARVNSSVSFENGALKSMDLSDENVEHALVVGARMQLAKQRQQLMASTILMGINRIVVTDGRISAKILYDFQARDNMARRRSAAAMDYAKDRWGRVQTVRESEREWDKGGAEPVGTPPPESGSMAEYFSKGKHKYEDKPIMKAMSTASEASDATLSTRASLAGNVEVNFKSDYLPLDKLATPGMIAAIQGNSTPVDPNVIPSAVNPPPGAAPAPAPAPAG